MSKPAYRDLCTVNCALKSSGGIGQKLDRLLGSSVQGNVHGRLLDE